MSRHQQACRTCVLLNSVQQHPAPIRRYYYVVVGLRRIIAYGAAHPWVKENATLLLRQNLGLEFHWHPHGFSLILVRLSVENLCYLDCC